MKDGGNSSSMVGENSLAITGCWTEGTTGSGTNEGAGGSSGTDGTAANSSPSSSRPRALSSSKEVMGPFGPKPKNGASAGREEDDGRYFVNAIQRHSYHRLRSFFF